MPSFPEPLAQPQGVVELPRAEPSDEPPRRMYVKRADLRAHGYTPGCPGCKALASGSTQIAHNEACRKRVAEAISGTGDGASRIKAVRAREDEYIASHTEKSAKIHQGTIQPDPWWSLVHYLRTRLKVPLRAATWLAARHRWTSRMTI
jgi:hypothetical protein